MLSISCAYTTLAVLARAKTRTRRFWGGAYAAKFRCRVGVEGVELTDRQKRFGGKRIAVVELGFVSPEPVPLADIPDEDYEREGFGCIARSGDWRAVQRLVNGVVGPGAVQGTGYLQRRVFLSACQMQPEFVVRDAFERWRRSGGWAYIVDWEYL